VAIPAPLQPVRSLLLGEASHRRDDAQLLLRAQGGGPSSWVQNYQPPMSSAVCAPAVEWLASCEPRAATHPNRGSKAVSPWVVGRQQCDALAQREFSQHLPRRVAVWSKRVASVRCRVLQCIRRRTSLPCTHAPQPWKACSYHGQHSIKTGNKGWRGRHHHTQYTTSCGRASRPAQRCAVCPPPTWGRD
jgi:hypothetical protein